MDVKKENMINSRKEFFIHKCLANDLNSTRISSAIDSEHSEKLKLVIYNVQILKNAINAVSSSSFIHFSETDETSLTIINGA